LEFAKFFCHFYCDTKGTLRVLSTSSRNMHCVRAHHSTYWPPVPLSASSATLPSSHPGQTCPRLERGGGIYVLHSFRLCRTKSMLVLPINWPFLIGDIATLLP